MREEDTLALKQYAGIFNGLGSRRSRSYSSLDGMLLEPPIELPPAEVPKIEIEVPEIEIEVTEIEMEVPDNVEQGAGVGGISLELEETRPNPNPNPNPNWKASL